MGWWSTSILGGDTPLDAKEFIAKVLRANSSKKEQWLDTIGLIDVLDGTATLSKKQRKSAAKLVLSNIKEIEGELRARFLWKDDPDNYHCAMQVLGLLCTRLEVAPPPAMLAKIVKACDEDEWATESSSRKDIVDDLKQSLLLLTNPEPGSLGLG